MKKVYIVEQYGVGLIAAFATRNLAEQWIKTTGENDPDLVITEILVVTNNNSK